MSKYVPDILSRRWVIISSQRLSRPDDFDGKKKKISCLFCQGNEKYVPNEVYRLGDGEKDKPGWKVRVIPNKFPITDFHEVIIFSPECKKTFPDLPVEHSRLVLTAYRDRFNFYRKKGQVLIFTNYGKEAGASIEHPHSQLVVIPFQINLDTLSREPLNNLVEETPRFNVYCPDFSQWPYELWISAKKENTMFGDISENGIIELATLFKKYFNKLEHIFKKHSITHLPYGYNFYIHPKENWYVRIIPRFVHRAGFELGTGLSVNVVDPIDAAKQYRGDDHKEDELMEKLRRKMKV